MSIAAVLVATLSLATADTMVLGLEIVPWSKKVGDNRYESPRDYDGTIKHFKDKLKGWKNIKWTREVSLPAVKYIHLENTSESSKWQGVNIYELPDGRVRYFVLERPKKDAPPAAAKDGAKPGAAKPDGAKSDATKPDAKAGTAAGAAGSPSTSAPPTSKPAKSN